MFHRLKTWLHGHPVWQGLISWGSFILVLIGLGGLFDDLETWRKWLAATYNFIQSLFTDIFSSSNFWRWFIFVAGMLGWLVSSDWPAKLIAKVSKWPNKESSLQQSAIVDPPAAPQIRDHPLAKGPPLFPLTEGTISTGSSADGSILTLSLENTSTTPIENCRLLLMEMQLWSNNKKEFLEFSRIRLPGELPAPQVLEPEASYSISLVVARHRQEFVVDGKFPLSIGGVLIPRLIVQKRVGVWRLKLRLLSDYRELTKELFFSWDQGGKLNWANDPRGPMYVTGKAF